MVKLITMVKVYRIASLFMFNTVSILYIVYMYTINVYIVGKHTCVGYYQCILQHVIADLDIVRVCVRRTRLCS